MLSKKNIYHLKNLQDKKYRYTCKEFVIETPKMLQEFFYTSSLFEFIEIYTLADFLTEIPIFLHPLTKVITTEELQKISHLQTPQKVVARVKIPNLNIENFVQEKGIFLVADHLQDPGNLGSLIRISDWFGFKAVICSEDSVDVYNTKTVQASMGSMARIPVFYVDLSVFLPKKSKNFQIFSTELQGKPYSQVFLKEKNAFIVLGNEANGVSRKISDLAHQKINIPKIGQAESLNVSVAAGIFSAWFSQ